MLSNFSAIFDEELPLLHHCQILTAAIYIFNIVRG
jgi:hypothetical protein